MLLFIIDTMNVYSNLINFNSVYNLLRFFLYNNLGYFWGRYEDAPVYKVQSSTVYGGR